MPDFLAYLRFEPVTTAFAFASVMLSVGAFAPYIRDTLRRQTRPERASWLIWSILSLIAVATQIAEGAQGSLIFLGTQATFTFLIFLLSVGLGSGSYLSFRNLVFFGLTAVGLSLWSLMNEPAYALGMAISVNALGGLATILKAHRAPSTETLSAWVICALASACGVAAVGSWEPMQLAYPAYLLSLYLGIVIAILLGRRRVARLPLPG